MRNLLARMSEGVRTLVRDGRTWVALSAASFLLAFAMVPSFGTYVDESLLYRPALKLRLRLGLAPTLDPRLKVLILDDQALIKHGREPTFAELSRAADRLFNIGFKRVIITSLHNLSTEVGDLTSRTAHSSAGQLFAGVVVTSAARSSRFSPASALPDGLLLSGQLDAPDAKLVMAPHSDALAAIARVGSLNALTDEVAETGFAVEKDRAIPSLGLLAAPDLKLENGAFASSDGPLARSHDGRIYINFVDYAEVLQRSVRLSSLLGAQVELSEKNAGKLAGGETALLITDGHAGSRFIDTPSGPAPSHISLISIANSAMRNDFIIRLGNVNVWSFFAAAFMGLLLSLARPRHGLIISAFLILAFGAGSAALLIFKGWYVPGAQMTLVAVGIWLARAAQHFLATIVERVHLSHELETGSTVQRLLLPASLTDRFGSWEIKVVFRPYGPMSGDWVQIFNPGEGAPFAVVAIGDVVGKGTSAALITAAIAAIWNEYQARWREGAVDLNELAETLDRVVTKTFKGEQNSTLSIAVLFEDRIRVGCFGAPSWLRIGQDGKSSSVRLKLQDPIGLKVKPRPQVTPTEVTPTSGDLFLAYSDGVIDGNVARNTLQRRLGEALPLSCDDIFATVEREALVAGSSSAHPDDITMLMVRYAPKDQTSSKAGIEERQVV